MGKRVVTAAAAEPQHVTPPITRTIRKRKRAATGTFAKNLRISSTASASIHNCSWHDDDEDSSSNDAAPPTRNQSSKQANNSSILLNSSFNNERGTGADTTIIESPKPVYTLRLSVVNGTILYDLTQKPWRLGRPIGKGNFGEIFLASDNIAIPVTNENAKFVVKIEPHSNGPLFVEIHCLMNTAKKDAPDENPKSTYTKALPQMRPSGIPNYIASGSHNFGNARYRFLVLQRFDRDLHSLIKNSRVHQKSVLTLAIQIVNVLENLHDKGYCHNDVKAQNLMISKCTYYKQKVTTAGNGKSTPATTNQHMKRYDEHYEEKQPTTDSGNSSEQETNEDDNMDEDEDFIVRRKTFVDEDDDEDFDDGATLNSNNSDSMDTYHTPVNTNRNRRVRKAIVEFSGSNPVRSCRRQKRNSIYEEMVSSHYLRPTKRISYSEFFNEDGSAHGDERDTNSSSADESEEFVPQTARRLTKKPTASPACAAKRLTRHQEKLLNRTSSHQQQHHYRTAAAVPEFVRIEEERIFLIDFGLASKFMDNGVHRPFVMDQRRAHDGTLEFTSRDAHMGAHSRRSDLECLGYNLIFWSQGYLPWKDAAIQHQQEKVHRAKEYLMTDVREMLKQIYGKLVPKYLGEFLHHVGQLAYHERPNYARYRRIFEREFQQLGCTLHEMHLDSSVIVRTCVRVKEELENKNDMFELRKPQQHMWSIMNNISASTPFQERTLSNRVSPKNLRSKSDKKSLKKKKFSWAEVLSQDPDQIARERAEKEFDREEELSEVQQPTVRRYEGKPTYAILEIQHRLKLSGRLVEQHKSTAEEKDKEEEDDIDNESAKVRERKNSTREDVEMDEDETVDESDEEEEYEAEDQTEEDDSETDTTDASDLLQNNNGRTRHTRNVSKTRVATTKTSSRKSATTINARTRGASNFVNGKPSSITEFTTRTRSTATNMTSTMTSVQSNKRGSAGRYGRKNRVGSHVASAASELEQHGALRYLETGQRLANGHGNGNRTAYKRRTRRCLIKTDLELKATEGEESNSNFSPDVRSLFNVWKKINNETMYFRGSSAAARHCKK